MACISKTIIQTNFLQHLQRNVRQFSCSKPISSSKIQNETAINSPSSVTNADEPKTSRLKPGPSFQHFLTSSALQNKPNAPLYHDVNGDEIPYVQKHSLHGCGRKVYFETYGCQMNVNDTEIASSILESNGFMITKDIEEADVIFLMTCSIREGAEGKIWRRLKVLKSLKRKRKIAKSPIPLKIGILGCMANRLKEDIMNKESIVDLICGPDAYRDLPRLLSVTDSGQTAANVLLSLEETYADVMPVRINQNSPSAFVSIMRGCDNMCTYCIVPFTRGKERSRPIASIVDEIKMLSDQGIKEVTLLGQNVNSYRDMSESSSFGGLVLDKVTKLSSDAFKTVYKTKVGGRRFSDLLDHVSLVDPEMRIRFTSPHPKDFPEEVLQLIKERHNICNHIHLPAQSGNNQVLENMWRGYTREAYIDLVHHIRDIIPDVALTSDFIAGFCGETEEAHQDTLSLMRMVKYNFCFCYPYSLREKTKAHRRLEDDVPLDEKKRRADELMQTFREEVLKVHQKLIGKQQLILIEDVSKRSQDDMFGRNYANTKVIVPNVDIQDGFNGKTERNLKPGDYVVAQIISCSSQVLHGVPLYHTTSKDYHDNNTTCCYDGYEDNISTQELEAFDLICKNL